MTNLAFASVWQLQFSVCVTILCDKFGFPSVLQVGASRLCDSFSFRICVTTLVYRLCDEFSLRVYVTNLVPASVCQLWFPIRVQV